MATHSKQSVIKGYLTDQVRLIKNYLFIKNVCNLGSHFRGLNRGQERYKKLQRKNFKSFTEKNFIKIFFKIIRDSA